MNPPPPTPEWYMPITPTQNCEAMIASAAFPPSFKTSIAMPVQTELSEAAAPSLAS